MMTALQRKRVTLVAKAVQAGRPLRMACGQYQLRDKILRQWLLEMGIDPHPSATLRTKDVQSAVTRWLDANAADKSVRAPVS